MGTLRQRPPGADGMTRRRWRTILGLARHGRAAAASESSIVVRMDAVRRELRGIALALVMVAATTLAAYVLIQYVGVRRGSVIYLLPVLLAGWHLGLVPALVAAVTGVLSSGYLFFSPYYSYYVSRPNEILNLVLFMVVAVVTSHLANSMKRQTELARKREKEMGDLYAFSRRLSAASSAADIYRAIEEHLANLVQRKVVLFGAGSGRDHDAKPEQAALPPSVHAAIAQVQEGRTLATTVDDGTGDVWLVRRVSQKTADFGVIAIDLGSVPAQTIDEVRHRVDDVLSDAAATLERLDVARALNDAKMRSETELLREALIGSVSHELRTPLASILGAATVLRPIRADRQRPAALLAHRRRARRGRAAQQRYPESPRCDPHQPRADQAAAGMDRAAGHRQLGAGAPAAAALRPRRVARHGRQSAVRLCRRRAGRAGVRADRRQRGEILSPRRRRSSSPPSATAATSCCRSMTTASGSPPRRTRNWAQRFFRGARHAAATSGSGLGLWIAKAFVGANGGKIQAVSAGADRGATVSIHLPFATPASQPEVGPDD